MKQTYLFRSTTCSDFPGNLHEFKIHIRQNNDMRVSCLPDRRASGYLKTNCFFVKTAILFFPLFIFFLSSFAQSGKMSFKNLTPEMGLSHGDVVCVYQDHEKYVWIGTANGLNKYDGVKFKVYKHDQKDSTSLPNSYITCIYEDKKNNLWIGTATSNGLCRYNRETCNFERILYTDEQNRKLEIIVTDILEDDTGKYWVCTSNGVFWFDVEKNIFHPCFTEIYGKDILVNFNEIHQDKSGILWFISEDQVHGGIIKYNPVTKETERYNTQHPIFKMKENAFYGLLIDQQENVWVGGASTGLSVINQHSKTTTNYQKEPGNDNSLSNNYISGCVQTEDGKILIGTEGGLNVFDPETKIFDHYTKNEEEGSILSNPIKDIFIGQEGTIWIACWGGGVSVYDKRYKKFTQYKKDKQTGYSFNLVTSFAEDIKGNIWIATDGKGIARFNLNENKFVWYLSDSNDPHTLTNNKVLAVTTDNNGGLWAGMWQGGLNYFQIKDNKLILKKKYPVVDENDPKSNSVFRIYRNHAGEIWVGNFETGAYLFDPETERFKLMFSLKDIAGELKAYSAIIDILSDSKGDVWFATLGRGLVRLNRETGEYEHFTHDEKDSSSISSNATNVVFEDSEKRLWVGSSGLDLLNRETKTFTHFTTDQGLPDNTIVGILEDNQHNLWISTNNGISKATIGSENEKLKITFRNYSTQDGLQDKVFNKWAFYKSKRGELYFGGISGFNAFYPDSIKDNPYLPPVHITDFSLFNKPVPIGATNSPLKKHISQTEELVLKHEQSVFTFGFVALNYIYSEKNQYAYMVEGFDKDWNYVGNKREATYTNLDPGQYTFRVKASNNDGIWNEKGTSIKIIVHPPWWQTWWSRGAGILIALSLAYSIFLLREKRIKMYNQKLEIEVAERTMQLQAANKELEAFSYSVSHDLRAPLRSIEGFSQILHSDYQDNLDAMGKNYLQRIRTATLRMAQLIEDMLSLSRVSRAMLSIQPVDISKLVKEVANNLTTDYPQRKVYFTIQENIRIKGDRGLLRILLENLIRNAWKFTSKQAIAKIEFGTLQQNDKQVFFVRDNGAGFNMKYADKLFGPFQRLHDTHEFPGTGIGLATVQRIIHRHGGTVWAEAEVGKGATFYFTIT